MREENPIRVLFNYLACNVADVSYRAFFSVSKHHLSENPISVQEHLDFNIDDLIPGKWTKKKSRVLAEHTNHLIDQDDQLRGKIKTMHFDTRINPLRILRFKQNPTLPAISQYDRLESQSIYQNGCALVIPSAPSVKPIHIDGKRFQGAEHVFTFYHELAHAVDHINNPPDHTKNMSREERFYRENIADVGALLFIMQQSDRPEDVKELIDEVKAIRHYRMAIFHDYIHFTSMGIDVLEQHADTLFQSGNLKNKSMTDIRDRAVQIVDQANINERSLSHIETMIRNKGSNRIDLKSFQKCLGRQKQKALLTGNLKP